MKIFVSLTALIFSLTFGFSAAKAAEPMGAGTNSCGYAMTVVPVPTPTTLAAFTGPTIIDAWTTNDLYNPYSEVYDFTSGQGLIAFVVEYYHVGGAIPEQWQRGWKCGNELAIVKTCNFKWTVILPPGTYLLINYFDPNQFPPGSFDWAAKVGNVVAGWPNIDTVRPWCSNIHPAQPLP